MSGRDHLGALAELRWPLAPLLRYTHLTPSGFARRYDIRRGSVCRAARVGLNDRQADHWATAVGLHPAEVWGCAWFDAVPTEAEAAA